MSRVRAGVRRSALARPLLGVMLLAAPPAASAPPAGASHDPQEPTRAPSTPKTRPGYARIGQSALLGEGTLFIGSATTTLFALAPQWNRDGWAPDFDETHAYGAGADLASDFTGSVGGSAIAAGIGFLAELHYLGDTTTTAVDHLVVPLIVAESVLGSVGASQLAKKLFGRCRPIAWDATRHTCDDTLPQQDDPSVVSEFGRDRAYTAMPSGHVAPIAGATGALLVLALRSEPSWERWTAFGVSESLTVSTMGLRVAAGAHSPTDVGAALLLGHGVGALVALLHPTDRARSRGDGEHAASIRVVPTPGEIHVTGVF